MSQTAFEMPKVLASRIKQGLAPEIHQAWITEKEDALTALQREFGEWIKAVSANEALFKVHVYENEDLNECDLRQHRSRICHLISIGELIVMGFMTIGEERGTEKEFVSIIETVDQAMKRLFDALIKWNAPLMIEGTIPEDLKQSIQELKEGKVVDLDI